MVLTPLSGQRSIAGRPVVTGSFGAVRSHRWRTFALGGAVHHRQPVYDRGARIPCVPGGRLAPAPGIGIQVDTPVGTMGIRGTFGGGGRQTPWDTWTIALFPEVDGSVQIVLPMPRAGLSKSRYARLRAQSITEPTTISVEDA
jgi:hypothetical protein